MRLIIETIVLHVENGIKGRLTEANLGCNQTKSHEPRDIGPTRLRGLHFSLRGPVFSLTD